MTSSNDAKKPLSSTDTPKKPNKSHTHAVIFGLTFVAIACSMGAMYLTLQSHKHSSFQAKTLLTTLNTLKQQQSTANAQIASTLSATSEAQHALSEKVHDLNHNLKTTRQQRAYQSNDWLLLKVRYYLELAQINAHWSDQSQTTVALLKEADELLNIMHDERLFPIRQAIAKEISELNALPQLDLTNILSQLDAAQNTVLNLSIKKLPIPLVEHPLVPTANQPNDWRTHVSDSLRSLENLVVIQRHDQIVQPIVTPAYEAVLRENIRLNLQEAQWTVLRLNNALYHLLLTQAIQNVNRSFDTSASMTEALLKQLADLQKIELVYQETTPKESLSLLNQVIDSKSLSETPPPTAPSSEGSSS